MYIIAQNYFRGCEKTKEYWLKTVDLGAEDLHFRHSLVTAISFGVNLLKCLWFSISLSVNIVLVMKIKYKYMENFLNRLMYSIIKKNGMTNQENKLKMFLARFVELIM